MKATTLTSLARLGWVAVWFMVAGIVLAIFGQRKALKRLWYRWRYRVKDSQLKTLRKWQSSNQKALQTNRQQKINVTLEIQKLKREREQNNLLAEGMTHDHIVSELRRRGY